MLRTTLTLAAAAAMLLGVLVDNSARAQTPPPSPPPGQETTATPPKPRTLEEAIDQRDKALAEAEKSRKSIEDFVAGELAAALTIRDAANKSKAVADRELAALDEMKKCVESGTPTCLVDIAADFKDTAVGGHARTMAKAWMSSNAAPPPVQHDQVLQANTCLVDTNTIVGEIVTRLRPLSTPKPAPRRTNRNRCGHR
jgi:hypothetical protein